MNTYLDGILELKAVTNSWFSSTRKKTPQHLEFAQTVPLT
jgi:hypothetical protein